MERFLRRAAALGLVATLALGPAAALVSAATAASPDEYVMNENGTLVVDAPGVLANDAGDGGAGICVVGYDYPDTAGTVTAQIEVPRIEEARHLFCDAEHHRVPLDRLAAQRPGEHGHPARLRQIARRE